MADSNQISNTQKVFRGVSSQTLVTIILGIVEIVSFAIMSRLLTKEDFGYYAAMTAIVTIFTCLSETGIGSAIVQQKDLTKNFINNAFTLNLLFGTFACLTLFVFSGIIARLVVDASMRFPLQLMSLTLFFNCLTSVNISIMHRRLQFLRMGMINLVSLILTTIVAVVLALKGFGYYAIIAKIVLFSSLTLFLSYIFAHTRYKLAFDGKTFKLILGFSGWLMASGFFRNLAHEVDKLVMSNLLSVVSLGAYNRPKDFINQISGKLNGIFDSALFPILSNIQDDKVKIRRAFCESLYFLNILGVLLTLNFVVNCELMIRIFFGEEWIDLKMITFILSFLMLFNLEGRLADCFMRSLGMTRLQFFFRIAETVTILVGVVVGSCWDIIGVAIAVVLANMILKLAKIFYISYKIKLPLITTLHEIFISWKFSLCIIPICAIAYILLPHTFLGNIVLLSVYVTFLILTFIVFPSIVGGHYKTKAYPIVIKYLSLLREKCQMK